MFEAMPMVGAIYLGLTAIPILYGLIGGWRAAAALALSVVLGIIAVDPAHVLTPIPYARVTAFVIGNFAWLAMFVPFGRRSPTA